MYRIRSVLGGLVGLGVLIAGCGVRSSFSLMKEAWNSDNLPSWFDSQVVTNFQSLPLSGMLDTIPWSGSSWGSKDGGLALRWLIPGANAWSSPLYSLDDLRSMSYDDIARLSPA